MGTEYFKKYYSDSEKLMAVVKVTKEGTLSLHDGEISIYNLKNDYYLSQGYKESNQEEFNSFYNKVQDKVNNLLEL